MLTIINDRLTQRKREVKPLFDLFHNWGQYEPLLRLFGRESCREKATLLFPKNPILLLSFETVKIIHVSERTAKSQSQSGNSKDTGFPRLREQRLF
jgi:hypothetical protein